MATLPTVSIVTATHNRRYLLEETLASIQAQTFADWELLVIDDASTDETWPYLRGLEEPRLRKFRLEQHGERSTARNLGLEAARGEYILFLDDDDLLDQDALQNHVDALVKYPAAIGAVGGYIMFDANARRAIRYVRRHRVHDIWPDLLFGHIPVFGQCLFRTAMIKAAGGWNGEFIPLEDHQLWLQLAQLGRIVLLPDFVLHYRIHDGQWRPRKQWKVMTKVRQRAVKRLAGKQYERAARIMQAREHFREGEIHYGNGETRHAARAYLKAVRQAPGIVRSPLTRAMILPPLMKCLFGKKLARNPQEGFSRGRAVEFYGRDRALESAQRPASAETAESKVDI